MWMVGANIPRILCKSNILPVGRIFKSLKLRSVTDLSLSRNGTVLVFMGTR